MLSLDQIQAAFNSSTIPTVLFSPSDDPVFIAVNDAFLRTSTRSREELLGTRLFAAFDAPGECPEDPIASALRASIAAAIDSGQPQTMAAQHYPIRVRQPDGSATWEDRYWNAVNAPVFDGAGGLIFILHYTLDITQQVKAQEQHRATTELYSTLIESMDDGFCIVDILYDDGKPVDYRFLDINPAFETQTGLRGARGKYVRELVPGLADTHWAELYSHVALTGEPLRLSEAPSPIGRWFNVYATRVGDPAQGKVAVLFTDVTESRRTRDDLRSLANDLAGESRRKTEFLATLAHELRNPLAPLRTGLDLLRLAGANPPPRVHEMMDRQLNQLVHLIDDLLDIARINSGKVELKRARIALQDAIANAVESAQPLIQQAGHALALSMPEAPLVLDADATRLAQVFSNLLTNAAKYTPPGGRIEVVVEQTVSCVRIAVTDTGIGIPPDALLDVFDMFSQVSRNMGRAQGGLGIGLSLVRSLVEMHGGSVRAESAGEGRGSSFVVELPLADGGPAAAARGVLDPGSEAREGRLLKVLVADDNVDAAKTIMALLAFCGHEVDVVHDGRRAVDRAQSGAYDLAILDIGMPGLDGYEVASALRANPACRHTYLTALTGWGSEADQARARAAGFDTHLTKPAGIAQIGSLLASLGARGPA